jgi:hypothetical protein
LKSEQDPAKYWLAPVHYFWPPELWSFASLKHLPTASQVYLEEISEQSEDENNLASLRELSTEPVSKVIYVKLRFVSGWCCFDQY